jgi:hypothetical protein
MKRLFTAIALASIVFATPALATTIHHQAAPSSRHLYMYAPEVAPHLQPNPTPSLQQQKSYGPSSMDFNNQAWPGGRPSRY